MLLDKLPWCSHQGDSIFSIHINSQGTRFATGGADHKVKVWNLLPALDARQENNPSTHKLLSTITDHNGPVNVVRFSSSGRFLASGSDDSIACIYELRGGPGGGVLGGEANIENWRTRHILRGHSSHIVDLGWSPDDSKIATASLDSTVAIWDPSTGHRMATLRAHTSFVKGVAWDPVGTYLATLSEDRSVVIWRTDDWSLVATISSPFERMVTATFACRISWSPDGRFLLAGNSFQGATHAAVAVPREAWDRPEDYLLVSGHGGAVVSTAFSPKLFKMPRTDGGEPGEELSAVFALGGQDRRVTVWSSSADRPIFCGTKLFKGQVVDLCWSPDGMTLLASSADGTVATMQFEESELGKAATAEEMGEVMKTLYGSSRGRIAKRVIAESAEQLELEEKAAAAAAAMPGRPQAAPAAGLPRPALAPRQIQPQQVKPALPAPQQARPADPLAALDARLGGAAAPGAVTQTGFGGAGASSLPQQQQQQQLMMPPPASRALTTTTAAPAAQQEIQAGLAPKRPRLEPTPASGAAGRMLSASTGPLLAPLRAPPALRVLLGAPKPLLGGSSSSTPAPFELQIVNKETRTVAGTGLYAEVSLVQGDTVNWHDVIPGAVVAAVGSPFFSAVATADGHVAIFTPAGRRVAPALRIGSGIARMSVDGTTRLLIVSTSGRIKLLDAVSLEHVMEAELLPLLEGGGSVLDVRLSKKSDPSQQHHSVPIVTLTDCSAYIWHAGLKTWLRVADDSLATSRYAPVPRISGQGELADVQSEAVGGSRHPAARLVGGSGAAAAVAQQSLARGVAENNLIAAEALGSAAEYKAWLSTYAKDLTEAGDEDRLRELADSLLGPPPGSNGGNDPRSWCPTVLGMRKRELLSEVVLREAARNRGFGGLLQRCRQALDEIEAAEDGWNQ